MNIIERAAAIGIETLLHFEEADRLCDLACNRDVLELGSYKGGSAWAMASTAKSLTCVDPFQADETAQRQAGVSTTLDDFLRAISRFTNVSFMQMTSEEAARVLEGRTFDMIFIDANARQLRGGHSLVVAAREERRRARCPRCGARSVPAGRRGHG